MANTNLESIIQRLSSRRNKLVRFYDNGGQTADRYTAVYLKPALYDKSIRSYIYWHRFMSDHPTSPQGVGTSGENASVPLDRVPAPIGRKHSILGKRILFQDLPLDVQRCVIDDLTN